MKQLLLYFVIITLSQAEFIQEADHRLGADLQAGLSEYRKMILRENSLYVQRHNSDPTKTFTLKLYPQYAALTTQELFSKYSTLQKNWSEFPSIEGVTTYQSQTLKAYNSLAYEYVNIAALYPTPVRNQQNCQAAYAIATVDTINIFFKSKQPQKKYPFLSIQQLFDCSNGYYNNYGYFYGDPYSSYLFIHQFGLSSQKAYPDAFERTNNCKPRACSYTNSLRYKIKGFAIFGDNNLKEPNDANCASRKALLRSGYPLTVSISTDRTIYYYQKGIIDNCQSKDILADFKLSFAVMVGFQVSPIFEENYLILKGNLGYNWGQKGYFRILDPPGCKGEECYDQEGIFIEQKKYNKCLACNYGFFPTG